MGVPYVTATDVRHMTPAAAVLFNGAKMTQHGLEVSMKNRAKPLEVIARHAGLLKDAEKGVDGDALARGLVAIMVRMESAAPIRKAMAADGD